MHRVRRRYTMGAPRKPREERANERERERKGEGERRAADIFDERSRLDEYEMYDSCPPPPPLLLLFFNPSSVYSFFYQALEIRQRDLGEFRSRVWSGIATFSSFIAVSISFSRVSGDASG